MIGQTILHYKILSKLGEGGMGVVYKAEDTKLERTVAIKFLPRQIAASEEERERFKIEAQAAAALNHPNIATIHAIEDADTEMFIVMEYIEGQELREIVGARNDAPMPVNEIIDYATQIAEGLQAAHKKDITHRDIKSSNIMITEEGRVKIMDFGLAKISGGTKLTVTGMTMGTVAYMSPEQARGETVDHRTDIWSYGVMLYEMTTGQLPFPGDYDQAVLYSVMNEDPEPIDALRDDVPDDLKTIINKALTKKADERYQNIGDLLSDWQTLTGLGTPYQLKEKPAESEPRPSIAVLPFANISADPDQEYFCDGIAEEIINVLTRVENLHVVARTSSFCFKGEKVDIREVGEKLNVANVLEGSVRKSGNRLRITAQLIKVADGYHLWSERFDRELEDVFAIQDEIARTISDRLNVTFKKEDDDLVFTPPTNNMEAYNAYLRGRFLLNLKGAASKQALEHYQRAVELDPDFAQAHAGLADAYVYLGDQGMIPFQEASEKAKVALTRALEFNPNLVEAHVSLAWLKMIYEVDLESAEHHYLKALKLGPQSADAHSRYGFFLCWMRRRFDDAIAMARKGVELDPGDEARYTWLGCFLWASGKLDEAIAVLEHAVALDSSSFHAHYHFGVALRLSGRFQDAINEQQMALKLAGRHPWSLAELGIAYSESGNTTEAEVCLNELTAIMEKDFAPPVHSAFLCGALGKIDQAFDYMEQAFAANDVWLNFLTIHPNFTPLKSDPRFDEMVKRMGLDLPNG